MRVLAVWVALGLCWQTGCVVEGERGAEAQALRALDAEEAEFLRLLNEYRQSNGLPALTATPLLNQVAFDHSAGEPPSRRNHCRGRHGRDGDGRA